MLDYRTNKKQKNLIEILLTSVIILLESFYFVPLITVTIRGIGNLLLAVVCISLIFIFDNQLIVKLIRKSTWFFLYILLEITYFLFINNNSILGVFMFFINLFAIFSIMLTLPKLTKKSKVYILSFTLIFFFSTIILTLRQLLVDPSFSRSIQDITERNDSVLTGAGSYNFIYACVIMLPLLFMIYKNQEYKKLRAFSLLIIPLLIVTVLKASYTIAIIGLLISISAILVWSLPFKRKMRIIIILSAVILIVYNTMLIATMLMKIANQIGSGPLYERLAEISAFLQGEHLSNAADLNIRQSMYLNSLETFIHNPFFGRAFLPFNTEYDIGGHSYILDTLGKYGVFSFICFEFFFKIFKAYKGNETNHKYYNITWFTFIVISSLNPISFYTMFFLLLVVAPIVSYLSIENRSI